MNPDPKMEDRGQVALKLDKRLQSVVSVLLMVAEKHFFACSLPEKLLEPLKSFGKGLFYRSCANDRRVAVQYASLSTRILGCACSREIIDVIANGFLYGGVQQTQRRASCRLPVLGKTRESFFGSSRKERVREDLVQCSPLPQMIDPLLLSVTRVSTLKDQQHLTNASGFFYSCGEQLFLVTSRHVFWDDTSEHYPDRILIELHTDPNNLSLSTDFSIPLYREGKSVWRQGKDGAGSIDVAVVEIDRKALPEGVTYRSFDVNHMTGMRDIEIGTALLVVGFPLGFHDTLHHLPVARQASVASCFDLRFQGQGYFLTDARTHSGMSGSPVVVRSNSDEGSRSDFKWMLAGVHSSRLDVGTRDLQLDEMLGLNCAWFADILPTLTATIRPLHTV